MSNGDYEFLRGYDEEERWVWLAARLESFERRLGALGQTERTRGARVEDIEQRCAERAWHGAALKAGVVLLVTTLLSSFGTLLFMVLNKIL